MCIADRGYTLATILTGTMLLQTQANLSSKISYHVQNIYHNSTVEQANELVPTKAITKESCNITNTQHTAASYNTVQLQFLTVKNLMASWSLHKICEWWLILLIFKHNVVTDQHTAYLLFMLS